MATSFSPQANISSLRAITFDMYGTLLDLEASFAPGLAQFLRANGCDQDAAEVVRFWEATYLRESMVDTMLGRGRTPFERIRRECLHQVLSRLRVDHTLAEVEDLLTSKATVSLYPDVQEGLLALRDGYTLAVLSNGDLGSLEQAVASLSIPVDRVISVEQVGVYKPHSAVYGYAAEHLGLNPTQILHVAAHPWDVRGAKAFGFLAAYLDRDNVPYGESPFQADLEIANLTELAVRLRE